MFNIIYAHAYLLVKMIFLKSGKDWAKATYDATDVFSYWNRDNSDTREEVEKGVHIRYPSLPLGDRGLVGCSLCLLEYNFCPPFTECHLKILYWETDKRQQCISI